MRFEQHCPVPLEATNRSPGYGGMYNHLERGQGLA